jgi:hypothetical protein
MIKILLVFALIISYVYFLRNADKTRVKAWAKLGILAVVGVGIISIIDPAVVETAAKFVGVGRGTDLLLYMFITTTTFILTDFYLKIRELKYRQDILISRLSILETGAKKKAKQ